MSRCARTLLTVLVLVAGGRIARAQTPTPAEQLLTQGIQSARDLDYDSAATLIRMALAHPTAARFSDADRSRALAYLGSTEVYRTHRDSAAAAFRRLLVLNPRYRLDQLIFPPEVTAVFEDVRRTTRIVAVTVPARTEITGAADRMSVRLVASSPHVVAVSVARDGGSIVRTLSAATVNDSLDVAWDGRDSTGATVASGRYLLRATSRDADGQPLRTVVVPLDILAAGLDTLRTPPPLADSLLKPEHTVAGHASRSLLTGLATGVAVVALPSLVSAGGNASGARFVVAGAASVAGIVGFTRQRSPRPIPENIAANQVVRLAWQRRADQVRNDNAARRRDARLVITAGPAQTLGAP